MAKFSLLLPVYNGMPYLRACVDSVLAQSLHDFELWVSDDGSTDGSRALLESYRDPRMHLLPAGTRLGLFGNLNRLWAKSSGTFLRVICQDDLLEPECLAREAEFFEAHPEVGMTFAKPRAIDRDGNIVDSSAFGDLPDVMPPLLTLQHLYYHGSFPGNLSTVAMRRRLVEPLGRFDETFKVSADYEMWFRIGQTYPVGIIHRHLLRVRRHAGQLSNAKSSGVLFIVENRRVRASILPHLPDSVRASARWYEHMRHDVLDFHYGLRSFAAGRWWTFLSTISALGFGRWLVAGLLWLWTLNNRRYRPQARWILPTQQSESAQGHAL